MCHYHERKGFDLITKDDLKKDGDFVIKGASWAHTIDAVYCGQETCATEITAGMTLLC